MRENKGGPNQHQRGEMETERTGVEAISPPQPKTQNQEKKDLRVPSLPKGVKVSKQTKKKESSRAKKKKGGEGGGEK